MRLRVVVGERTGDAVRAGVGVLGNGANEDAGEGADFHRGRAVEQLGEVVPGPSEEVPKDLPLFVLGVEVADLASGRASGIAGGQ
ncbi:hypothetical protein AB0H43_02910 [Hamadaea sp. NPDC050747]|uniref:hypothetical protein n=1 Tax=Hamadaea sp. NPDC050747 TaxID=3155789 RepID=UPI0033DE6ABB